MARLASKSTARRAKPPTPKKKATPKRKRKLLSAIEKHAKLCTICKHKERNSIERLYLRGYSGYILSDKFNVSRMGIYNHAKATGIDQQRDLSVLSQLRIIISKADLSENKPSDGLTAKALEMTAKITGEMTEKIEIEGGLEINIHVRVRERLGLLLKRLGYPAEVIQEIMDQEIPPKTEEDAEDEDDQG